MLGSRRVAILVKVKFELLDVELRNVLVAAVAEVELKDAPQDDC